MKKILQKISILIIIVAIIYLFYQYITLLYSIDNQITNITLTHDDCYNYYLANK